MKIPVSVIILTFNEELNIARCLNSLSQFDERIIVDSGSTDSTLDIVGKSFPDVRIFSHDFEDFGAQRNWAIDETQPRHEWILFVDADEFMEQDLAEEIDEFVKKADEFDGGFIAGRNYFLGKWLKRTTFFPSYQLRLLKRGKVRFKREGHGQREVTDGKTLYLKNSWYHDGFSQGVAHWIERHNRYSSAEVELVEQLRKEPLRLSHLFSLQPILRRRCLKRLASRIGFRPLTRFFYTYFWRLGFLDGKAGLLFCMLRFAHEIHIMVKLGEKKFSSSKSDPKKQVPESTPNSVAVLTSQDRNE